MESVFETERLRIRPWTMADAESFFAIYRDPEVSHFIAAHPTETLKDATELLAQILARFEAMGDRGIRWAILEKESGKIVGTTMLKPLPGHDEIEVGWHLAREVWGKGYATEAARGAIRYGFERQQLERIVAVVHPDNARSLAVARRLGLTHEGRILAYEKELELFSCAPSLET